MGSVGRCSGGYKDRLGKQIVQLRLVLGVGMSGATPPFLYMPSYRVKGQHYRWLRICSYMFVNVRIYIICVNKV